MPKNTHKTIQGDIMTVVGFNFTKIKVEKNKGLSGKININSNVSIKNVEETKIELGKAQKALKLFFEFSSKYEPKIGEIVLEGEMTLLEQDKKADEVLATWKKDKQLPKEVMASVLNTALTKCNIQALILSQHVNLPPPIQLPKVEAK